MTFVHPASLRLAGQQDYSAMVLTLRVPVLLALIKRLWPSDERSFRSSAECNDANRSAGITSGLSVTRSE